VTHLLTIRAQNKNFINQVVNHARIEITRVIRDYQDWLGDVSNAICGINADISLQEHGIPVNWLEKHAKLTQLFFSDRRSDEWLFRLVEHEILFPKTATCLGDLGSRQAQITKYLSSFLEELPSGFEEQLQLEQRKKAVKEVQENIGILLTQQALMEDLRNYLQNLCLSSFTGNKIPERRPEDLSLPKLVQDKNGNLQIGIGHETTKNGDG